MIKRVVSSIILVPIVVYLVMFAPLWLFNVFLILTASVALFEWVSMEEKSPFSEKFFYVLLGVEFVVVALFFRWETFYFLMVLFIAHMVKGFSSTEDVKRDYYLFGGILYVALYVFFSYTKELINGGEVLMLVFASLWVGDSFAYFCGKGFGRIKLAPRISPNKTVEGAICGVVFGTVAAGVFGYILHVEPLGKSAAIGFVANVAGIFGDLSESVIKRAHNRKDSSNLIPGHGGVLDRLDSPAFAVFVIYLMFVWRIL